jgi:hypothetical protein
MIIGYGIADPANHGTANPRLMMRGRVRWRRRAAGAARRTGRSGYSPEFARETPGQEK